MKLLLRMEKRRVTTHCNYTFQNTEMKVLSVDENNMVMSGSSHNGRLYGQMWHPERIVNKSPQDVIVFKEILKGVK